jgi:hypothetical protein
MKKYLKRFEEKKIEVHRDWEVPKRGQRRGYTYTVFVNNKMLGSMLDEYGVESLIGPNWEKYVSDLSWT